MKNRSIPFGYCYADGVVITNDSEFKIVKAICQSYLDGESLLTIANQLNEKGIEYMPGVTGWNKARLMRILEDKRYLGTETFPAIVDESTYEAIKSIKMTRNTQKDTDRSSDIFKLDTPIICPKCGAEMQRLHDKRCKCKQRWVCINTDCGERIVIADEELLRQITEILNIVIENPNRIKTPKSTEIKADIEVLKIENEINRTLESLNFDKEDLRKAMLRCVSLKYKHIDHTVYAIKKMKRDFERQSTLTSFSAELTLRTVKAIVLNTDKTVYLTLINDQIIRKEFANHAGTHHTNDAT